MSPVARALAWTLLAASTLAALVLVVGPAWYLKPFSPQTAHGLDHALGMREASPWATTSLVVLGVVLAAVLWRGAHRWWCKAGLVALPALAVVAALLARFNQFEAMFAPLPVPQFARGGDAGFVEPGDVVLSVDIRGESAAYPVRLLAYHHVVQDEVGAVPLVATY